MVPFGLATANTAILRKLNESSYAFHHAIYINRFGFVSCKIMQDVTLKMNATARQNFHCNPHPSCFGQFSPIIKSHIESTITVCYNSTMNELSLIMQMVEEHIRLRWKRSFWTKLIRSKPFAVFILESLPGLQMQSLKILYWMKNIVVEEWLSLNAGFCEQLFRSGICRWNDSLWGREKTTRNIFVLSLFSLCVKCIGPKLSGVSIERSRYHSIWINWPFTMHTLFKQSL